jgi:hypothetical protein
MRRRIAPAREIEVVTVRVVGQTRRDREVSREDAASLVFVRQIGPGCLGLGDRAQPERHE